MDQLWGAVQLEGAPPPNELEFWVRYWIAAYRFILENAGESTTLISYGRLTAEPEQMLQGLAQVVEVSPVALVPMAGRLRSPRVHEVEEEKLSRLTIQEAERVFQQLRKGEDVRSLP